MLWIFINTSRKYINKCVLVEKLMYTLNTHGGIALNRETLFIAQDWVGGRRAIIHVLILRADCVIGSRFVVGSGSVSSGSAGGGCHQVRTDSRLEDSSNSLSPGSPVHVNGTQVRLTLYQSRFQRVGQLIRSIVQGRLIGY